MNARGFPVEIRSPDFELTPALKRYAMEHLASKLEKHASRIQSVVVRFEDGNGARGGIDKICRVEVLMAHLTPVIVEELDQDLRAAIDIAGDRVEEVVSREMERARGRPRTLAHRFALVRKTLS